jgi:molecular chaperone GrpE
VTDGTTGPQGTPGAQAPGAPAEDPTEQPVPDFVPVPDELDEPDLAADLAAARAAVAVLTNDVQRLQAEYVNYKRRVDRDRDLVRQNATYGVLSSLLPVLDDIDRAREHGELEGGFKAVADSLERVVSGLGLTKFGAPGEPFDPNVHEALAHGHSPDVTETVVEHLAQAGYRIGDRVVRAAKVTVLDPEG